jgi:hypothetical protein
MKRNIDGTKTIFRLNMLYIIVMFILTRRLVEQQYLAFYVTLCARPRSPHGANLWLNTVTLGSISFTLLLYCLCVAVYTTFITAGFSKYISYYANQRHRAIINNSAVHLINSKLFPCLLGSLANGIVVV